MRPPEGAKTAKQNRNIKKTTPKRESNSPLPIANKMEKAQYIWKDKMYWSNFAKRKYRSREYIGNIDDSLRLSTKK